MPNHRPTSKIKITLPADVRKYVEGQAKAKHLPPATWVAKVLTEMALGAPQSVLPPLPANGGVGVPLVGTEAQP